MNREKSSSSAPPEDLPTAKQIRVEAGHAAAQMEDGSWVLWCDNKGIGDPLNEKLAELCPLKDLNIGSRFFIAIK